MRQMHRSYKAVNMGALVLVNFCLLFLVSSCSVVCVDQDIVEIKLHSRRRPFEAEWGPHKEDSGQVSSSGELDGTRSSLTLEDFCKKHPLQCSLVDKVNLNECASLVLATDPERVECVPFASDALQNSGANLQPSYLPGLLSLADFRRIARTISQQTRRQLQPRRSNSQNRPMESSNHLSPPIFDNNNDNDNDNDSGDDDYAMTNNTSFPPSSSLSSEVIARRLDELGYQLDPIAANRLTVSGSDRMRSFARKFLDKIYESDGNQVQRKATSQTVATVPRALNKRAPNHITYLVSFEEAERFVQAQQQQQQRIDNQLNSGNQLATVSALPFSLPVGQQKTSAAPLRAAAAATTTTRLRPTIAGSRADTRTMAQPLGEIQVNDLDERIGARNGGEAGSDSIRRSIRLHRSQAVVLPKRTSATEATTSHLVRDSNSNSASAISTSGDSHDNTNHDHYRYQHHHHHHHHHQPQQNQKSSSVKELTRSSTSNETSHASQDQRASVLTPAAPASAATESSGSTPADAMQCKMRHFTYRATKRDELGNECGGMVTAKICYGGCDTGEIADWLFPYKKSIHKVCQHGGRVKRMVLLDECNSDSIELVAELRKYYYVDAVDCVCKKCTSVDTTCLGTMSGAPHLQTLNEAVAEIDHKHQAGGGGGGAAGD